jgi:hypothetical protein
MHVLIDESLPRPLAARLTGHEVRTVSEMGWSGLEDSVLLLRAATAFDALVTADPHIEAHQTVAKLPIVVVVLVTDTSRLESLEPLVPELLNALETLQSKTLLYVDT